MINRLYRAVIVLIIVCIMIACAGCGNNQQPAQHNYKRMKLVEQYKDLDVYVDTATGIAYGYWRSSYDHGLFPLYDAEGEHYRPNGWRDVG